MTLWASDVQCLVSLLDKAAAEGLNRAAAASIDVKRKADCERTKDAVCTVGSRPHLVCAKFS